MNLLIVKIIGSCILLCVVGAMALSGLGRATPDWAGHVVDVGIGALAGLVVGGTAAVKKGEETNE